MLGYVKWTVSAVVLALAANLAFAGVIAGTMQTLADDRPRVRTTSPDGRIAVDIVSAENGPRWSLSCEGRTLVEPSRLGLSFHGQPTVGLVKVVSSQTAREGRWGRSEILFEEEVTAKGLCAPRRFVVAVKVSDDGAAFRYEVPRQAAFDGFQLVNEQTEWRFANNPSAWTTCFDSEKTSEEESFERGALGDVPVTKLIGLPVVANVGGRTLALCEANLTNWAGLFLRRVAENPTSGQVLEARLAALPSAPAAAKDVAVIRTTPAESPWRVVLCAEDDLGLIRRARMIRELNPPPETGMDFSWVKPGVSSWDWWAESNNSLTTEKTLEFVDFAAEMGWSYHTIDGGWYGFARSPCHGPNVKIRPRPGFDLLRIVRHAADKGVGIIVWMHWMALEENGVEETFAWLEQVGVKGVKIDFLERQDQRMVVWTEKVVRKAARHRLLVNFHGSFHPSGTERTWPNCITREAIRGNEMNLFNRQATSRHAITLPFTRFLLGPGDYTPGSFANVFARDFVPIVERGHRYGDETSREGPKTEEMGTRAQALARCVAFDSPLMTLCDWPERYRAQPGHDALRRLPTVWRRTIPVSGVCGEHYAVLREAADGSFYFAAMTVEKRSVELDLGLIGEGRWTMEAYADDPERTPTDAKAVKTIRREVRHGEKVRFDLLDEGGVVAILRLKK